MDPDLMRMPIDQVPREIRMRSMFEGILTPNVALILTCDNPRALGLWISACGTLATCLQESSGTFRKWDTGRGRTSQWCTSAPAG